MRMGVMKVQRSRTSGTKRVIYGINAKMYESNMCSSHALKSLTDIYFQSGTEARA